MDQNLATIITKRTQLWLKITTTVTAICFLSLLVFLSIVEASHLNQWFSINHPKTNWEFYSIKIYLIFITSLLLIANGLLVVISYQTLAIKEFPEHLWLTGLLSLITLNFYCFGLVCYQGYKNCSNVPKKRWWQALKQRIGFKKWITRDYILIALFASLTIICAFLEENILPHLPFGGGFGIKYLPLMALSFSTNFLAGWLSGCVSAFIALLFIPASNIISPWSFLFDYLLPLTTPAIVALLPFNFKKTKTVYTFLNYFCHCFLVLMVVYCWQVISGYFIWVKIYPTSIWKGYQPLLYSLVYNFIHIFIFTYPILQITIPPVYRAVNIINK